MIIIGPPRPKPSYHSALPRLRPSPYPSTFRPLRSGPAARPSAIPFLPLEIISLIFGEIDDKEYRILLEEDDEEYWINGAELQRATLASCCRVSKAFLPLAREFLYYNVSLERGYWPERSVLYTLERSSSSAALVRSIAFRCCPFPKENISSELDRALESCYRCTALSIDLDLGWMNDEYLAFAAALETLATISARRPDLDTLSITLNFNLDDEDDEEDLHAAVLSVLHTLPGLKHLRLRLLGNLPFATSTTLPIQARLETVHLDMAPVPVNSNVFSSLTHNSHTSLRSLHLKLDLSEYELDLTPFRALAKLRLEAARSTSLEQSIHIFRQLSDLPLRHLECRGFDAAHLLDFLPLTLETLKAPRPRTSDLVQFILSGRCPKIQNLDLREWAGDGGSPWEEMRVRAASREMGLELRQAEPLETHSDEDDED